MGFAKKLRKTALAVAAAHFAYGIGKPLAINNDWLPDAPKANRTIDVCVLNAQHTPQTRKTITATVRDASDEFHEATGVDFNVTERGVYNGDITKLLSYEETTNPHTLCTKPHDIALIFTSRYLYEQDDKQMIALREQTGSDWYRPLLGAAITGHHFAVIGNQNNSANPTPEKIVATVQHEVAHLLGVGHWNNERSIMNPTVADDQQWMWLERNYVRVHGARNSLVTDRYNMPRGRRIYTR